MSRLAFRRDIGPPNDAIRQRVLAPAKPGHNLLLPLWRRALLAILRVRVSYAEGAKALEDGPCIVACRNHRSMIDGVVVALAAPRALYFPVNVHHARRHPGTRAVLSWMERRGLGTIVPMDGAAIFGLRHLRRALLDGHSVCIFPEGKIGDAGASLPEQPGHLWLANSTGRPMVWIKLEGAERSRLFARAGDKLWPRIHLTF